MLQREHVNSHSCMAEQSGSLCLIRHERDGVAGALGDMHHYATKETNISWVVNPITSGDRHGAAFQHGCSGRQMWKQVTRLQGVCLFNFEQGLK